VNGRGPPRPLRKITI